RFGLLALLGLGNLRFFVDDLAIQRAQGARILTLLVCVRSPLLGGRKIPDLQRLAHRRLSLVTFLCALLIATDECRRAQRNDTGGKPRCQRSGPPPRVPSGQESSLEERGKRRVRLSLTGRHGTGVYPQGARGNTSVPRRPVGRAG